MDNAILNQILNIAFEKKVSDIHFEVDNPPMFRARGHLIRAKLANLTRKDTEFVASTVMEQHNRKLPEDLKEFDTFPLPTLKYATSSPSSSPRQGSGWRAR